MLGHDPVGARPISDVAQGTTPSPPSSPPFLTHPFLVSINTMKSKKPPVRRL